jgi:hypothetical protein
VHGGPAVGPIARVSRNALGPGDAEAAAQPSRITIGYTTGLIVTPAVRELRHRHSDAEVRTLHLDWNEPRVALLDHRVDARWCPGCRSQPTNCT